MAVLDQEISPSVSTPQQKRRPPHPFTNASLLSKLLFFWPYELMKKSDRKTVDDSNERCGFRVNSGDRAPIEEGDLPDVLEQDSSERNLQWFHRIWEAEKSRVARRNGSTSKQERPSLQRAIAVDFMKSLWYVQPLMLCSSAARLVQALALGLLLESFETSEHNPQAGKGYLWSGVLVVSGFVVLMEHHHVFFYTWRRGMQYRIACVAAIYDKSLRLSSCASVELGATARRNQKGVSSSSNASSGNVVNIATNDVERFLLATLFASYIWWAPIQSVAILIIGFINVGWSFVAGFGMLCVIFAPLQVWLGNRFAKMRSKIAAVTDERVTLVSQAVSGVRVMKMSGWEDKFNARIASIRERECRQIERVNLYRALNESIFFVSSVTISTIIFLLHVANGGLLSPRNVFSTIVLINVAQMEITKHLSLAVMGVSECQVSISRIQRYIESPELAKVNPDANALDEDEYKNAAVVAKNITCYWNGNARSSSQSTLQSEEEGQVPNPLLITALKDVTVHFNTASLTCVIGAVGSGKSALVQMIAGELTYSSGVLQRAKNNTVAYAPQDPWIMDGSIKENILMGLDLVPEFYERVVTACGLNVDMAQLRGGENTIVGDRGVQLSGGQRSRIALARVFYRDADVLLLDDPLSAVDSKVGRGLVYAISKLAVDRGKCVILVTHQHQYIGDNRCVLMDGGRITCVGSYQDCLHASNGKMTFKAQHPSAPDLEKLDKSKDEVKDTAPDNVKRGDEASDEPAQDGVDDHKELSKVGVVGRDTFLNYLQAMPGGIMTGWLMMLLFTATQGSVLGTVAFIGMWSEMSAADQSSTQVIAIVVALVVIVIILALARAFSSFHLTVQASKNLHDAMTRAVLKARVSFFDTNPLGRILNRFSSDVGSNDDLLPNTLFDFLVISFLVAGALLSAVVVLPVTLLVVPPLCWYFVLVRSTFVTTSRELKRLEGLSRSPIFAMLSESLTGISTIRPNGAIDYFQKKFFAAHDAHGRSFFAFIACSRWLGFRMDSLMFVFLAVASFTAVLVQQNEWFSIDPGILGLAISMLVQLSGLFQWCIRQSAEVVNQFVAVERVIGFRDLPSEAALSNERDREVKDWPSKGEIDVSDLCVRYRAGLPLSLRGVTFKVEGGGTVGVVGRTGGGKSTLVQSLLRLLEADSGLITIDGVDIKSLGLHKLRNAISVIPQQPMLYGGVSIRDNLDPFQRFSTERINEALDDVHMSDAVQALHDGLDTIVAEGGTNFSVGQRQLLCLARAILRRNRILVLDEPTANVDSRTDTLLQEAVAKSFHDATILAVAHRLDTIIEYSRILVLGGGRVLEYGSPRELVSRRGEFYSMIQETGEESAANLIARAKGVSESR